MLTLASTLVLLGMRADNRYGVGEFAGMFFRQSFLAMTSVIRYYQAHRTVDDLDGRASGPG